VPFFGLYAPKKTPDAVVKKLEETVRTIAADKAFQDKNRELDIPLEYEGTAAFEKYQEEYKQKILSFFRSEGLVK
jgi:tripartite-type tricarboxylate transporter receptor subunit TctC